ncbi:MAG: nucleotidyltransferase family protein [Nanoarchaeota archaeon]
MEVIIPCAGYATRLHPLTLKTPKALLPVRGKKIIDYIIDSLPANFFRITIVSNASFYSQFSDWAKRYGSRVAVLNDGTTSNETRLGGIGDIWFAIKNQKIDDDTLIILGDNLFDFALEPFIDFFKKKGKTATGVFEMPREELKNFGVVGLEGEKIVSFEEKPVNPKSSFGSTGIYALTREDLAKLSEYISRGKSLDGPGFFIEHLLSIQDVYGFVFKGRWFDIGTPSAYEQVNRSW